MLKVECPWGGEEHKCGKLVEPFANDSDSCPECGRAVDWCSRVGDRYENELSAFLRGSASLHEPRVEDFIAGVPGPRRKELVKHLLDIDFERRGYRSAGAALRDYFSRLPHEFFNDYFDTLCEVLKLQLPCKDHTIEGYRILEVVGVGGMGVVYKVEEGDEVKVFWALKMLLACGAPQDGGRPSPEDRFRNEARVMARLREQYPTSFLTFNRTGTWRNHHYLVMDYIEGARDLNKEVKDSGPFRPQDAAQYLLGCAAAVTLAHQMQIVHRDLKPANVVVTRDGHPRIADWGIAKRLGQEGDDPASAYVPGTLRYMPPEQLDGKADKRSDVYGLGGIGYYMLTKRPPNKGESRQEIENNLKGRDPPPDPRLVNPRAGWWLSLIVKKCLRKDPNRRYQSAGALETALETYLLWFPWVTRLLVSFCAILPVVAPPAVALVLSSGRERLPAVQATVLGDLQAYIDRCKLEDWPPLPVKEDEPIPSERDYSGLEFRLDSRFWDLTKCDHVAPGGLSGDTFATRAVVVVRKKGAPNNTKLYFKFTTSGKSINPRWRAIAYADENGAQKGAGLRKPDPIVRRDPKRKDIHNRGDEWVYELELDLSSYPVETPLRIVIDAIYTDAFAQPDTSWTAVPGSPAGRIELGLQFPPRWTFDKSRLFKSPIGAKEREGVSGFSTETPSPREDRDNGRFAWTLKQEPGGREYELEWTWRERPAGHGP